MWQDIGYDLAIPSRFIVEHLNYEQKLWQYLQINNILADDNAEIRGANSELMQKVNQLEESLNQEKEMVIELEGPLDSVIIVKKY